MENCQEWQHPFVDVFKKYNTFECPKSYKGSVTVVHDPVIARRCFKVTGSILSNNAVTIPDPTGELKTTNLIGRYLYVELLTAPEKYFCIHLEIGIKDREPGVRLTLTNMEKEHTISGGNTLKIPLQTQNGENRWTIACVDLQNHLQNHGLFPKGAIKNYSGVHTVRGLQVCSNLTIRGIYTSNNIYEWTTLPKEMAFKLGKGGKWEEHYDFKYLPKDIDPAQTRRRLKEAEVEPPKEFPHSIVERDQVSTSKKATRKEVSSWMEGEKVGVLPGQSYLELKSAFSFSSLHNPDLLFQDEFVYYSAGSVVVRRDINTGEQTFLQGHTDYIVAMDSADDWLVTVQEGSKSSVRVWIDHKCVCSFQCPYEKVQQLRLNNRKELVMVGLDSYKRQALLLFDISEIETTRKPVLLAKQISDFNILTIQFSPVEHDKLVSCGKENIRFWRVKNQHLPGTPVVLNQHARNTVFTVLDFEYSYDDPNPLKQRSQIRRVYVGSQSGLLFQVNYATRELEEVYKLHDGAAITSLAVSSGFCVTGGQDQLLRVWQMDFTEYILEAANDGVVTSLTLSSDSSQVAAGTSTGALSVLDLTTNNYRTIVRAHTESVDQLVYHTYSQCVLSLSRDLTIRLWDPVKLQQTYEFSYPSDDACLCLAPNSSSLFFAAGFKSGALRIFDIENTCVVDEIKHHSNPIKHVQYSPDGRFLAVLEEKMSMLYSPQHSHQPVKHLPIELPGKYAHCCFSEDSQTLAVIGDSSTHINLWELRSLQMTGKIFTGKVAKKLKFEGQRLWVLFEDTSIRRYNTVKMTVEVEMQALHRNQLNAIDFQLDSHLLFSVGDDSFVKVWDYSFLREPHQVYIGHARTITDVLYLEDKLWTSGSEGILVWNFKDQGEKFVEPPVFAKEKKATFIRNQQAQSSIQESRGGESHLKVDPSVIEEYPEARAESRIVFSNLIKKTFDKQEGDKFVPTRVDSLFMPKVTVFKKSKKRQGKPKLTLPLPPLNVEHSLPMKHTYQEDLKSNQLDYARKIQEVKQHNKKYRLEFLMGLGGDSHDQVVWNFMYGWYAYIYDNLIIVESLNKARSQRIITLPEKLCSLLLTKDYKRLICSSKFNANQKQKQDLGESVSGSDMSASSIEQQDENNTANIYVLGTDFSIERKLEFHPRGVQSIRLSDNGKYLVSTGNFRECTVCVWDFALGRLKASSYTLDKINDLALRKTVNQGNILEFATVGRDQIHFWTYTRDEKLEYYDVFVKGDEEEDEIVELTACDYLTYHDNDYLMYGTTQGQLGIMSLDGYRTVWRKKICSAEIMNIKACLNFAVLGVADGNIYFWNLNTNILQADPMPSFNKMNLYYTIGGLFFDEDGVEGVVATSEAIYYVNLQEQFHSLLVGAAPAPTVFAKTLNTYLLTSHQNARLKLWNLETAEELKTYKWRQPCTDAYFDESINKLVCFCANNTIKLVNLKRFTKEENFFPDDFKPDAKPDDFVLHTAMVTFGGRPARWNFHAKGNVFSFELTQQGRKKHIKSNKVLELGYKVKEVIVNPEKNLILASAFDGTIYAYNVDHMPEADNSFSLLMVDKAKIDEFGGKYEDSDNEKTVRLALSKVLNETYLAINTESQSVFFRNYMKRITFQRISLPSWPTSIILTETKKESEAVIGLREGGLIKLNTLEPEQRLRYEGIVNDSVDQTLHIKSKNLLLLTHPSALSMYTIE